MPNLPDSSDHDATGASDASGDITFRSDVTVELVRASARDADVVFAARVSTVGEYSVEDVDSDAQRTSLIFLLGCSAGTADKTS